MPFRFVGYTILVRRSMGMQRLKKYKKQIGVMICGLLVMGGVCLLLYEPMMYLLQDPSQLKNQLNEYGLFGELLFSLVMTLQVVFVFLPGEIVEVVAGFLYGPWMGMFICLFGAAMGGCIIYWLVGRWGKKWVQLFISEDKLNKVYFLKNTEKLVSIVFVLFFIPGTPKDLITYFLPFTSMKLTTFLWVSSVARIPSVVSSTIAGNALGIQEYTFGIVVFAITGIVSLLGLWGYKNWIHKKQMVKSLENL